MVHKPRPLNPKQLKFVAAYLKSGNAGQAALAAGYTKSVSEQPSKITRVPAVAAALAAGRNALVEKGIYGLERAMKEAEDGMEFAKETRNANAYVKAVEHRAKLNGLLVERVDMRTRGFQLIFEMPGSPKKPEASDEDDDVFS